VFVSYRLLFLLVLSAAVPGAAFTQPLSSLSTRWSDSFVEWSLYAYTSDDPEDREEEEFGELKLRWLNVRNDWTEWDYEFGGERGTIRRKWKDDPSQWELRGYNGHIVSLRTAWTKDYSEWRVTDNSITLVIRSRYTTTFDEWVVQDQTYGRFSLYTFRRGDPRDWAIEDGLSDEISPEMRLALAFIAVFNSSPKE
jgi:hypothetical protein